MRRDRPGRPKQIIGIAPAHPQHAAASSATKQRQILQSIRNINMIAPFEFPGPLFIVGVRRLASASALNFELL
jgi:hypothetical protein